LHLVAGLSWDPPLLSPISFLSPSQSQRAPRPSQFPGEIPRADPLPTAWIQQRLLLLDGALFTRCGSSPVADGGKVRADGEAAALEDGREAGRAAAALEDGREAGGTTTLGAGREAGQEAATRGRRGDGASGRPGSKGGGRVLGRPGGRRGGDDEGQVGRRLLGPAGKQAGRRRLGRPGGRRSGGAWDQLGGRQGGGGKGQAGRRACAWCRRGGILSPLAPGARIGYRCLEVLD